jgi:hypothetical protein
MMIRSSRVKYASLSILFAAAAPVYASVPSTMVALTGATAPGGATYIGFNNPEINASGEIAYNANLSGGSSGIFLGQPGSIGALALQGGTAPNGETYGSFYTSTTATTVNLSANGQAGFTALLSGGTPTSGIFVGSSNTTTGTVALQGTATPYPGAGNFSSFLAAGANTAYSPVINPSGQLAIQASLSGGTAAAGIFSGTSNTSIGTVAVVGGPTPTPPGYTYSTTVTVPTINKTGQVAFVGLFNGSTQGLFIGKVGTGGAQGAGQTVFTAGTPAPNTLGTPTGENFGNPGTTYSFNDAGQVGFQATLTGNANYTSGVFVGTGSGVQAIALNNTLAPGGTGGNFTTLSGVTINGAGRVAFSSSLTGGSASTGLFVGSNTSSGTSSVQAIALAGGIAPDGAAYGTSFSSELQNNNGQVAFAAFVTGTGVTTGVNDRALFGGSPGSLSEIVRDGDVFDFGLNSGGNEFRTVAGGVTGIGFLLNSGGQDGKGITLNDNGEIAYKLTFTDGSSGIFESAVPEPASLSLLAAGAGTLLLRSRRRQIKSV